MFPSELQPWKFFNAIIYEKKIFALLNEEILRLNKIKISIKDYKISIKQNYIQKSGGLADLFLIWQKDLRKCNVTS